MTTLVDDMQAGLENARRALGGARVHDPDAIQYWTDRASEWERAVELAREGRPIGEVYTLSGLG